MEQLKRGLATAVAGLLVLLVVLLGIVCAFDPGPVGAREPLPEWVSIQPAQDCSQGCWRIADAYYLPQEESNGLHHLFGRSQDIGGAYIVAPMTLAWSDGSATANTKLPPDWGDHALWDCFFPDQGEIGGYSGWIGERANSDVISGMGLPYCHHVTYWVTWRWNPGGEIPTPTPTIGTLPYSVHLPLIRR